jgi:peptidoglycan/LPS O-acetylase OafA/YrhL
MEGRGSGRYWSLDVIRGLAALSVLVTHWAGWTDDSKRHFASDILVDVPRMAIDLLWHSGGIHPGVVVFIVLSGFCVHLPVARSSELANRPGFWTGYLRRRAFRVLPVLWIATLLGLLAVAFCVRYPSTFLSPDFSGAALLISLSGLSGAAPIFDMQGIFPGNGPLATVGVELLLYASYPVVLMLRRRGPAILLAVAICVYGVLIALRVSGISPYRLHGTYLEFFLYWILGVLAADLHAARATRERLRSSTLQLGGAAILFFGCSFGFHFKGLHALTTTLLALLTALTLENVMTREQLARTSGRAPSRWSLRLAAVGTRSYSLYAVHTPVLAVAIGLLSVSQLAGTEAVRWISFAAVLVVTELFYRAVESPSARYARANAGGHSSKPVLAG